VARTEQATAIRPPAELGDDSLGALLTGHLSARDDDDGLSLRYHPAGGVSHGKTGERGGATGGMSGLGGLKVNGDDPSATGDESDTNGKHT
jgi:hypothetical protein